MSFFAPNHAWRRLWSACVTGTLWIGGLALLWLVPSPCCMVHWRETAFGLLGPFTFPDPLYWRYLDFDPFPFDAIRMRPVWIAVSTAMSIALTWWCSRDIERGSNAARGSGCSSNRAANGDSIAGVPKVRLRFARGYYCWLPRMRVGAGRCMTDQSSGDRGDA